MIAAANREWTQARKHFQAALREAEALGADKELAQTLDCFAEALLARGRASDRKQAASLIDRAAELYGRIGMPLHLERLKRRSGCY